MLLSTLFSMADRALVVIKHECSLDQVSQRSVADICEDELEKGEYFVFVEFDWGNVTPNGDCEFVLTAYSEAVVEFEGEEDSYLEDDNGKVKILSDVFRSKA